MNTVVYDLSKPKQSKVFGTVSITFVQDPFNPIESRKHTLDVHGMELHKYLEGYCLGAKYLVSVNSQVLGEDEISTYVVKQNDVIVYTPVLQGGGGGGKSIIALVAMIAISIVSMGAGAVAFGGTFVGGMASVAAGAATWGAYALSIGLMVAGSLLISSLLGQSSNMTSTTPETESSTYSWTGATTSRDLGSPIPVLYGTHALPGTVINSRIYYRGDDDWIATQIALCHGKIKGITSDNIYINDLAYSSYVDSNGNTGHYTYSDGAFDQPIITGYDDSIHNNSTVSRKLSNNTPYNFTTISNNMNYFRLHFECPNGLYSMDSAGNKSSTLVECKVDYRVVGSTEWTPLYNWSPNGVIEYEYAYNKRYTIGSSTSYVWSTDPNFNEPLVHVVNGNEDYYEEGEVYPIKTNNVRYTKLDFVPTETITFSGNSTNVFRTYIEPVDVSGNPKVLPRGQYEFRVTPLTTMEDDNPYLRNNLYVRYIEEIETSNINYGGIALLAIDLKATDQLNNTRPNFKTIVTRQPLYLNGKYVPSDNPAWACLDILTNKHYGMGVPIKSINIGAFERWASFCEGTYGTFTVNYSVASVSNDNLHNGHLLIPASVVPVGETMEFNRLIKRFSTFNATKVLSTASSTGFQADIDDVLNIEHLYLEASGNRPSGFYYKVTLTPTSLKAKLKLGTSCSLSFEFKDTVTEATPRLAFNGVLDTTTSVWEAIQDVATIGRAQIVLMGTKYSVIFDAPRAITGLYNAANSSNLTVTYLNQSDIASEIEVQFADKNLVYEMNSISVQDLNAMSSQVKSNKVTKSFKGIVSEEEALIMGRYLLASSKYLRRVVTLDADIESITQTVGDVIAVQTDVTQYGVGGLVIGRVGNIVTFDNTLHIEKGKNYTIKVKQASTDMIRDYQFRPGDDTEVDYLSIDALGDTLVGTYKFDDFTLILNFDDENYVTSNSIMLTDGYTINVGDRYTFGIENSDSLLCTITDISREGDLTRKISAIEYNESILDFNYDNDIVHRITPNIKPKNVISNFVITDRLVKLSSSQVVAMLSLSWESVTTGYYNLYTMEGDFKNYLVMGIKGNRYEYPAVDIPQGVQTRIFIEDASDNSLVAYNDYTITSFATPPPNIDANAIRIVGKGNQLEFKINYLNKPLDFNKYSVNLNGSNNKGDFISDVFYITPEKGTNTVHYRVKAVDLIGKESQDTIIDFTTVPPNVASASSTLVGDYVSINLTSVKGTFDISHYNISYLDGVTRTVSTKEVSLDVVANWIGARDFTIIAVDVIGNESVPYTLTSTLQVPSVVNLNTSIDDKDAIISWEAPSTKFNISHYTIEYVNSTNNTIYIDSKTTSLRIPIFWGGNKTFRVRANTSLGSYSEYLSVSLGINIPVINSLQSEVIDNNVLLKWASTHTSLPIENYILYKGESLNNLVTIGEKKGTFTTIFENESGTYTYWLAAVDSAGNFSEKLKASASVSEPPNYVLNLNKLSTFDGTKVNAITNGSNLLLPVNITDSVLEHFDSNGWDTALEQVNEGYTRWIEPFEAYGKYEELIDYGAVLPSSMVSITLGYDVIKGSPNISYTISLSLDNVTWVDYSQAQVYGSNFRYIKLLVEVSGVNSAINVHTFKCKIDSKEKTDSGRHVVSNTGTFINFNKSFVDISSITVTPESTTPVFALYDFEDTPNPLGFTAYIFNTDGIKVNGTISWIAKGY